MTSVVRALFIVFLYTSTISAQEHALAPLTASDLFEWTSRVSGVFTDIVSDDYQNIRETLKRNAIPASLLHVYDINKPYEDNHTVASLWIISTVNKKSQFLGSIQNFLKQYKDTNTNPIVGCIDKAAQKAFITILKTELLLHTKNTQNKMLCTHLLLIHAKEAPRTHALYHILVNWQNQAFTYIDIAVLLNIFSQYKLDKKLYMACQNIINKFEKDGPIALSEIMDPHKKLSTSSTLQTTIPLELRHKKLPRSEPTLITNNDPDKDDMVDITYQIKDPIL